MMHGIYQRVGVHEDTLGELCKSPAVQLREGHAKVRPSQKVKVDVVVAVEHVDDWHQVKQVLQMLPADVKQRSKVKVTGSQSVKALLLVTLHYITK